MFFVIYINMRETCAIDKIIEPKKVYMNVLKARWNIHPKTNFVILFPEIQAAFRLISSELILNFIFPHLFMWHFRFYCRILVWM